MNADSTPLVAEPASASSSSSSSELAAAVACDCSCIGATCPCGSPCVACFAGRDAAIVAAVAASSSSPPTEPSWEELLFRRQYAGLPIASQLRHLSPIVPRLLPLYAAYFFFRTRGYALHGGGKIGADYVAYPTGGPEKWHAQ